MTALPASMFLYWAMCAGVSALAHFFFRRYILATAIAVLTCHLLLILIAMTLYDAKAESLLSPMCITFSLMCATPVALATGIPFKIRRLRQRQESRGSSGSPRCTHCDYNLTGNASGICPECGTPIPEDTLKGGRKGQKRGGQKRG